MDVTWSGVPVGKTGAGDAVVMDSIAGGLVVGSVTYCVGVIVT